MTPVDNVILWCVAILLLMAVVWGAFSFGWLRRAKHERAILRKARAALHDRPLGAEERAAVDLAFIHIEQAFEELRVARRLRSN